MYLKITDGQPEPYSILKLRRDNPSVAFPKQISATTLASFGVYSYTYANKPAYDEATQKLVAADFQQVGDVWERTWAVVDKTAEEVQEYQDGMKVRVKREAERRILNILPEWKQRNLTARAAELAMIGQVNWTAEEQAEWDAGQALWDQIKAVRASSDALEAMDPIPSDFADDKYWG